MSLKLSWNCWVVDDYQVEQIEEFSKNSFKNQRLYFELTLKYLNFEKNLALSLFTKNQNYEKNNQWYKAHNNYLNLIKLLR